MITSPTTETSCCALIRTYRSTSGRVLPFRVAAELSCQRPFGPQSLGWGLTRSEVTTHDARAGSQRMMLRPYFFGLIAQTVTTPPDPPVTRNTTSSLRSHAIM